MSTELERSSTALEGIVTALAPSLVSVHSHQMRASGFAWRPGLIITSSEGLAEEGDIQLALPGGERVPAQLVGRDPSTAVALLKIERSDLRSVALAAALPSAGSLTVAIGAEDGAPTAGFGMVSVSRGVLRCCVGMGPHRAVPTGLLRNKQRVRERSKWRWRLPSDRQASLLTVDDCNPTTNVLNSPVRVRACDLSAVHINCD